MFRLFFLVFVFLCLGCFSCTINVVDGDTDSNFDSDSNSNSVGTDSTDDTDNSNVDTADGQGGVGEACYEEGSGEDKRVWCNSKDLHATICDQFNGCCCKEPCAAAYCGDTEDATPCIKLATGQGFCNTKEDQIPVLYECQDSCVPRSMCDLVDDTTGECQDSPPDVMPGICLMSGTDTDAKVLCQPLCQMSSCSDQSTCNPIFNSNSIFEGFGICSNL